MSKIYVGYDGNYGSAEEYDLVIFDDSEMTEAQLELLDNDPTEFYTRYIANDWENLEEVTE